jgi:hypothetical protein
LLVFYRLGLAQLKKPQRGGALVGWSLSSGCRRFAALFCFAAVYYQRGATLWLKRNKLLIAK